MRGKAYKLLGKRFGELLVIRRDVNDQYNNTRWVCKCSCGNTVSIYNQSLVFGRTKSCGCRNNDHKIKHGMSHFPTYITWASMIRRCTDPNCSGWKNYGGRGIKIEDPKWFGFESFFKDMGIKPKNLTLDRKNNSKGYYKSNCRWADRKTQSRNNRNTKLTKQKVKIIKTLFPKKSSCKELAKRFGCSNVSIYNVINNKTWV